MKQASGTLMIVSAPSGAGKTSLVAALVEALPGVETSVSHTTRARRPGETDGINYNFIAREAFATLVDQGRFLEYAEVFGNFYGTSRDWVEARLASGCDVVLEIDWQGALQVKAQCPDACLVFILPPSFAVLKQRLQGRGSDSAEVIAQRLAGAKEEMSHYDKFDYVVVNEVFDEALQSLCAIVTCQRLRLEKQQQAQVELLQDLLNTTETR